MANPIPKLCWFEIPVTDFERAKSFYEALLDGPIEIMEMGPVTMGFLPNAEGGVAGAITLADQSKPSNDGVMIYFEGGDDLTDMLNRVEPAGGAVLEQKTDIGNGFGFYALFQDTEGNRLGLHSNA